jgi:hypothetical protein
MAIYQQLSFLVKSSRSLPSMELPFKGIALSPRV